jgi:hypothetical protein
MAGRCYVYGVASAFESQEPWKWPGCRRTYTKLYCANMSKQVADRAIQVRADTGMSGNLRSNDSGVTPSFWRLVVVLMKVHKNMSGLAQDGIDASRLD